MGALSPDRIRKGQGCGMTAGIGKKPGVVDPNDRTTTETAT
jgi:hypothetical protein